MRKQDLTPEQLAQFRALVIHLTKRRFTFALTAFASGQGPVPAIEATGEGWQVYVSPYLAGTELRFNVELIHDEEGLADQHLKGLKADEAARVAPRLARSAADDPEVEAYYAARLD